MVSIKHTKSEYQTFEESLRKVLQVSPQELTKRVAEAKRPRKKVSSRVSTDSVK